MRTKLYMIALAAMTMILGSCSDSNSEFSQDYLADTPIKLNVSVDEPRTRAGYSDEDKPTGFVLEVKNNKADKYNYLVWVEGEDNNWKTYKYGKYNFQNIKEEVTMLWANMNDNVKISAISDIKYHYGRSVNNHPTDQTTLAALKKADLLAMPTTEVAPTQKGINVKFKHTMSKINLTIELGDEYEFTADVDKKITDVVIDGSMVKAVYEFKSSTDNPQFSFKNYSGDPTPITPFRTGTTPYSKTEGVITKASATYEAILIPQNIASGKFTVSFKVDGKLYEWAYNNEAGLTLASNTAYTLKLIAGDDKVQPVSFSVAPWGVGNGPDGEKKETD